MVTVLDDTIAAIATPPGAGGIAIVRISGPGAASVAARLLRQKGGGPFSFKPREAMLLSALSPSGKVLDEVLALYMPGPRSYTREDVVEIHCHGGAASAAAILDAALAQGSRLASPGEFTLRAFLRGRIDLVQAEAVADLINAASAESLSVHEKLLSGGLSEEVGRWQELLGSQLVLLEASLDFPEEELPETNRSAVSEALVSLAEAMESKLSTYAWGRTASEGYRVAVVGAPNVGKSSLFNQIIQDDRSIVSPHAGTTRDTVDMKVNVCGAPVVLVDTAGLRGTADPVEREGVQRAKRAAHASDLILFVLDSQREPESEELRLLDELAALAKPILLVLNKADLPPHPYFSSSNLKSPHWVSALTGQNIEPLLEVVRDHAWGGQGPGTASALTRTRHRLNVEAALQHTKKALELLTASSYLDAAASELQGARAELRALLGWGTPEDVINNIFAEFCIGK